MIRSVVSILLDHWKKAVITAIAGAGIAVANLAWHELRDGFMSRWHSLSDDAALQYARMSEVGSRAEVVIPYYDVTANRNFIAVAYRNEESNDGDAKVQLLEVVDNQVLPIGKPLAILDVKGAGPLDEEKGFKVKHYFGFVHAGADKSVQLFAISDDFNTGGYSATIALMDVNSGALYTLTHETNSGGILIGIPNISKNVEPGGIRAWLFAKSSEVLQTAQWNEAPLVSMRNGLQTSPASKEFLLTSVRRWFEQNGINATEGALKSVEIPTNVLSVRDAEESSNCALDIGRDRWYIIFKGPIVRWDSSTGKMLLVYVPDPHNFREPQGMVLSKNYLLLALVAPDSDGLSLVAWKRQTGTFVHLPIQAGGPQLEDDVNQDVPASSPEQANNSLPLKDISLFRFGVEGQQLMTEYGAMHLRRTPDFDPQQELASTETCSEPKHAPE
ncbi:hypothetical protein FAZ69_13435 [Trinickia terrae]|uniref:Uncharacterized protein n=1 Tax=Trinickia terrae TaxID=2571161 RepID=A0A4U1I5X0_9BURK|nr:hypothetical protein [Trinickia terrae]TKC88748.1 hypothetical protein FAZ69_13435 [Trinickia terrae]